MENINLTNSDLEDVEILKRVTQSIKENYDLLIDLEIKGEKESISYKSTINSLKKTLELENNIVDRICANPGKNILIIDSLITSDDATDLEYELKVLIDPDFSSAINQRMVLRLFSELIKRRLISNDIKIKYDIPGQNLSFNKSLLEAEEIGEEVKKDVVNTILFMLNKHFVGANDFKVKTKYKLAFLYDYIENDLINNNYEVSDALYWTSKALFDYRQISPQIHESFKTKFAYDLFCSSLDLYMVDYIEENYIQAQAYKEFSKILIRTSLMFSSKEFLEMYKDQTIKYEKYFLTLRNFDIANQFSSLLKILDYQPEDIQIPRVISLKP